MKKRIILCLTVILSLFAFSSCNKENSLANIKIDDNYCSECGKSLSETDGICNECNYFTKATDTNNITYVDISNAPVDEIIKISIANDEQINDTSNYTHYYDSKTNFQTWKIIIESLENIKKLQFIELDSSEELKISGNIFEIESLEANKPLLIHTYINDSSLNRGISLQDDKGNVRYFSIGCSMRDGSLLLTELNIDKSTVNIENTEFEASPLNMLYKTKITEINPIKYNIPNYFGLSLQKEITFKELLSEQYFTDIKWDISSEHILFVAKPVYQSLLNTIDSIYISFNVDSENQVCSLHSFSWNYENGEFYTCKLRESVDDVDSQHMRILENYSSFAECWLTFVFDCVPSLF